MELSKINHAITQIKEMLKGLVQIDVISIDEAKNLLTPLVLHAIRNDNIDVDYES